MCGCGTDRWCVGYCECGCDHDTLEGQSRQAQHFALQWQSATNMMDARLRNAERRGFDNGVLFEVGRIREEIDALKDKVAFGSKPGYRQGFTGCWHLVRGIVMRPAGPSRDTS
jgi:hypothetical protein